LRRRIEIASHIDAITSESLPNCPHGDTVANALEKMSVHDFCLIRTEMISRLLRMRVLEKYRLLDTYYMIAIDATGMITYSQPHCDKCLTKKLSNGTKIYYHPVLEAKLVTRNGLAFSVETEFIENPEGFDYSNEKKKQDCELNAFKRLVPRLKRTFPQLKIVLLLDSLYAASSVFELAKKCKWQYLITFKKGSIPTLYEEFETLLPEVEKTQNRIITYQNGDQQQITWLNDNEYAGHKVHIVKSVETDGEATIKQQFVFLSSLYLTKQNSDEIVNQEGRRRWVIENQGFNSQKNRGYNLEHAYSEDEKVSKCFYILMQIAHIINQLMERGSLLKKLIVTFGSYKNFTLELCNQMTYQSYDSAVSESPECGQIRLDTS
jgi:hypothetical protein